MKKNSSNKKYILQLLKEKSKLYQRRLMKSTWWILASWTVFLIAMEIHDHNMHSKAVHRLMISEARVHFQKDKIFRYWATSHGGFYVPVDERTTPNSYLEHIPERDIVTPAGVKLTLMNPAWALRQINEDYAEKYDIAGHITSLLPLNPINIPDDWEKKALKLFKSGETEIFEFYEQNGVPYIRLMQPLITKEGCLKCHGHQGYKVGDVRGGVSVTIPLSRFAGEEKKAQKTTLFSFVILWIVGFGLIIRGSYLIKKEKLEQENTQIILQQSYEMHEVAEKVGDIGSWKWDVQTNVVTYSNNAFNLYGIKPENYDGNLESIMDVFHPEDREIVQKKMEKMLVEKRPYKFEYRIIKPNGEIRFIEGTNEMFFDNNGNIFRLIGHIHDITERKKAEDHLKNRNKELELFNEITVGRELKMIELKKEINELYEQSGKKPKYKIPS
jgi:PAS domain S-box-containing protein